PVLFDDIHQVAFDLDGDGDVDDAAGIALAGLLSFFPTAAQELPQSIQARIDDGMIVWPLEVPDARTVPDAPDVPDVRAVRLPDGAPASALADVIGNAPIVWEPADAARAELAVDADGGGVSGRLGFAMPAEVQDAIAVPLARY